MVSLNRKKFLTATLGLSLLPALSLEGCGSGKGTAPVGGAFGLNSSGGSGGLGAGGALSDAHRAVALEAVRQKEQSLIGQPLPTLNRELVAFMKTRPEFADAGISADATAWGRFRDGRLFLSVHNEVQPKASSKKAPVPSRPLPPPTKSLTRAAGLPETGNAFVFNAMEAFRTDGTATVAQELRNAGYTVTEGKGTISDWMGVKNCGVLLFHCHGGSDDTLFYLSTSDLQSAALDKQYAALLTIGDLIVINVHVYQDAAHQLPARVETHYGIGSAFLIKNTGFSKNSFVCAQACTSDNKNIKGGFFLAGLTAAPASLYAGWTDISNPDDTTASSLFLFDRLLGLNKIDPVPAPASPPPPGDFPTVEGMLSALGPNGLPYDQSFISAEDSPTGASVTAHLTFTQNTGDLSVIVPSIALLTKDTTAQTLTLAGQFGSATGTVRLNDTMLPIKRWSATSIVTDLPSGSGDVQVFVNTLASNKVPFSLLQITPASVKLAKGGSQSFTVTLPPGLQGTLVYAWSTTALIGNLSDGGDKVGQHFETSSATVNLLTSPSDVSPFSVSVTAYQVAADGSRKTIGDATATVTLATQFAAGTALILKGYDTGDFRPQYKTSYFIFGFYTLDTQGGATEYQLDWVQENGIAQTESISASLIAQGAPEVTSSVGGPLLPYDGLGVVGYGETGFMNVGGKVGRLIYRDLAFQESEIAQVQSRVQALLDAHPATVTIR